MQNRTTVSLDPTNTCEVFCLAAPVKEDQLEGWQDWLQERKEAMLSDGVTQQALVDQSFNLMIVLLSQFGALNPGSNLAMVSRIFVGEMWDVAAKALEQGNEPGTN